MNHNEDFFIPCVVQPDAAGDTDCDSLGHVHSGTAEFVVAQAVRKLVATEMSDDELSELGFKRPVTKVTDSHCDTAIGDQSGAATAYGMVDATMRVICDQIKNVDLEAEMLSLRKRALKRRLRLLERLARSIHSSDEEDKAA